MFFVYSQWSLFDKNFGRTDAQEPDPEGRIPRWDKANVQEMKDKISALGFGPRQVLKFHFLGFASSNEICIIYFDFDMHFP